MTEEDKPIWRPVSREPVSIFDPMVGAVKAHRINFALSDGTRDYVTIPDSELTPERVEAAIDAEAAKHIQVMGLRGVPTSQAGQLIQRQRG